MLMLARLRNRLKRSARRLLSADNAGQPLRAIAASVPIREQAGSTPQGIDPATLSRLRKIEKRLTALEQLNETRYGALVAALRARDAEASVKKADAIVMEKAPRLINPKHIADGIEWAKDYRLWHQGVMKIDGLAKLLCESHSALMDTTEQEYSDKLITPPAHIVKSNQSNHYYYVNVSAVHPRYINRREGILARFASMAAELPN